MKPTPHTSPELTFGEMLEEVIDLSTGLGVALLPMLLLAMPGIILFVVLPAILLLALGGAPGRDRRGDRRAGQSSTSSPS